MDYLKRERYLERLTPFIGKELIKVIVGQRRVGKSYFLFQIMDYIREKEPDPVILYINKEDLQYEFINTYSDLVEYVEAERGEAPYAYLFVDEIQDIHQFEKALRHLQSQKSWDIYITGSNARLLSGELATLLSGRYLQLEMFGLSYSEFLLFHRREDAPESFLQYLRYGGLPYLHHIALRDTTVFPYLRNVYAGILFKDVISRHKIRNTAFLERLTAFLADNIGQLISAKKISDYLKSQKIKLNHTTVLHYLDFLTQAYFVFKVQRSDLKGKRLLEIGEKYYFGDLGIRHAIKSYQNENIGQLLENVVYLHLRILQYQISVGKLDHKEIDFVCEKEGRTCYIQVTLSLSNEKVQQREYGNLLAIPDNERKIVITADEYHPQHFSGIEIWNIRKFLLEFE